MLHICHDTLKHVFKEYKNMTYYVPIILFVLAWESLSLNILAVPKSEIFGIISLSSKMLLVFKSLWIIFNLEYLWRYKSPWAIPSIMLTRVFQPNVARFIGSEPKYRMYSHICWIRKKYEWRCTVYDERTKKNWIQALIRHVLIY